MRTYVENNCRVQLMESGQELIDRMDVPPVRKGDANNPKDFGFIGRHFSSLNNARDNARILWKDGMDMLDGIRRKLAATTMPTPKSRRRRLKWDDSNGDEIM